jgi:hypothetical protein
MRTPLSAAGQITWAAMTLPPGMALDGSGCCQARRPGFNINLRLADAVGTACLVSVNVCDIGSPRRGAAERDAIRAVFIA